MNHFFFDPIFVKGRRLGASNNFAFCILNHPPRGPPFKMNYTNDDEFISLVTCDSKINWSDYHNWILILIHRCGAVSIQNTYHNTSVCSLYRTPSLSVQLLQYRTILVQTIIYTVRLSVQPILYCFNIYSTPLCSLYSQYRSAFNAYRTPLCRD